MLRAEVLHQFVVRHGEIATPGQWEGAPIYAPYFYAQYRRGREADRKARRGADILALYYTVTQADRLAYPELLDVLSVVLYVDLERARAFVLCEPEQQRFGRRPNVEDPTGVDDGEGEDEPF